MTDDATLSMRLDEVFGPGESTSIVVRALDSGRQFVRGLDLLTVEASARAKGRRLTAYEALEAYGFDKLCEVLEDGSAIISHTREAAGKVLKSRREELNLSTRTIAAKSHLSENTIETLERSGRRPVREYEQVARLLGLDERAISFKGSPVGNERVAVRLRTIADERVVLGPSTVANLAEAAWVAMTQVRLEETMGMSEPVVKFERSDDYGRSARRPAYQVGYELADSVRTGLGLSDEPIESMRSLAEEVLRVPVIQVNLGERVAGATVEVGDRRAVVLNLQGLNANAMVRRSTLAHELCHLLFDPSQQLESLRVDEYAELDQRADERADVVEQRANAFAVQLLAPQDAAVSRYKATEDLFGSVLDFFGLSFTAGRYQVWNGLDRDRELDSILAPNDREPSAHWEAMETYTITYHPIRALAQYPARAGRFSALAIEAARRRIVSWDTVSEWLMCTADEARAAIRAMADLYPDVVVAP